MSSPDELARQLRAVARPCVSPDIANELLSYLRKAAAVGSPNTPEPLHLFVTAGGVEALAKAMKVNTPVFAEWPEGTSPAIDLAALQQEAAGVLNNLAAAALAPGDQQSTIIKALREAELVPVLVATVDAFSTRSQVLHRVLPALAQLTSVDAVIADQVAASDAIRVVVRCMNEADESDAWIHCSATRILNLLLQRGDETKRALLHAGALAATMRALNASADETKLPKGFGFTKEQLRQKLAAMGAPLLQHLSSMVRETYKPGAKGTLQGLAARSDLNNAEATLEKPKDAKEAESLLSKGRVKVQAGGECLAVKYSNLVMDVPIS